MSSHHIVRDKQEPALLILDYQDFPFEILGNLLEWSPTVICTEKTFEKAISLGIKVDVLISSNQSIIEPEKLENQYPLIMHSCDADMEISFILNWLVNSNYTAISILTSERNLPVFVEHSSHFSSEIQLVLIDNIKRHLIIARQDFHKWMPENSQINLTPIKQNGRVRIVGGGINIDAEFTKTLEFTTKLPDKIVIKSSLAPFIISLPHF